MAPSMLGPSDWWHGLNIEGAVHTATPPDACLATTFNKPFVADCSQNVPPHFVCKVCIVCTEGGKSFSLVDT